MSVTTDYIHTRLLFIPDYFQNKCFFHVTLDPQAVLEHMSVLPPHVVDKWSGIYLYLYLGNLLMMTLPCKAQKRIAVCLAFTKVKIAEKTYEIYIRSQQFYYDKTLIEGNKTQAFTDTSGDLKKWISGKYVCGKHTISIYFLVSHRWPFFYID